jgi:hypothetical protein
MDRTEAKLKFGNALTSSSVGPLLKDLSPNSDDSATISTSNKSLSQASDRLKTKKYSEVTRKGTSRSCNSVETDRDLENSRADFFSYCLSLLRSSASENGDDLPVSIHQIIAVLNA